MAIEPPLKRDWFREVGTRTAKLIRSPTPEQSGTDKLDQPVSRELTIGLVVA